MNKRLINKGYKYRIVKDHYNYLIAYKHNKTYRIVIQTPQLYTELSAPTFKDLEILFNERLKDLK